MAHHRPGASGEAAKVETEGRKEKGVPYKGNDTDSALVKRGTEAVEHLSCLTSDLQPKAKKQLLPELLHQ